jgi:GMP synthase PP-ATPase subunit
MKEMSDEEALAIACEIVSKYGLKAEYLSDDPSDRTVGVQGDFRTYARPLVIIGPFPGWDVLEKISREISNQTSINKVTFEMARKQ